MRAREVREAVEAVWSGVGRLLDKVTG